MSQLVPCPNCARHVRLAATCPFCDFALDVAVLSEQHAPRRDVVPAGSKRAALFALGAGMAAACGTSQPAYGAVEWLDGDGGRPQVTDSTDRTTAGFEQTTDATGERSSSGANVAPLDGGSGAVASTGETRDGGSPGSNGSDAGSHVVDAASPYSPDAAVSTEARSDAAVSAAVSSAALNLDAGNDASALDASVDLGTEPTSVALYGAPPPLN